MPINLTQVKHHLDNVKRKLFFPSGITATFLDINEVLLELDSGWYCSKNPVSNLAIGEEYFEMSVVDTARDDVNLEDIIPNTSKVKFAGETYKVDQYFRPRQLTKEWLLRLGSLSSIETDG